MRFPSFSRVILVKDLPESKLLAGDMGTVVEHHEATPDYPEGYEVEFFAGNGESIGVSSVKATDLRSVTRQDILHVRQTSVALTD